MEKQLLRGQQKISIHAYEQYKDQVERQAIQEFLMSLPIDKLKEMIKFEVINPFDGSIPRSMEDEDYRYTLRDENAVEIRAEILI